MKGRPPPSLKENPANLRGRADPSCGRGPGAPAELGAGPVTLGSWKNPIKKENPPPTLLNSLPCKPLPFKVPPLRYPFNLLTL